MVVIEIGSSSDTPPSQQQIKEERNMMRQMKAQAQDIRKRENPATGDVYAGIKTMRYGG